MKIESWLSNSGLNEYISIFKEMDSTSLKFWKHNLMEIQKNGIEIEFYLLVAGNPVEISLANIL